MNGSLILCYHRVLPVLRSDPWGVIDRWRIRVELGRFRSHMEILARLYKVVPLHDLLAQLARGSVRRGQVAITFDDGYVDNYVHAFPVLDRLGLPATVFLTTDNVEHGTPFWWDRLSRFVLGAVGRVVSVPSALGGELDLRSLESARRSHYDLFVRLSAMDGRERDSLLDTVGGDVPEDDKPLSWEQARTMQRCAVYFGAHSRSHPSLVALSELAMRDEIVASRDFIVARLGARPDSFAYPFGYVDERVSNAVESTGFLGAVTTVRGVCTSRSQPYLLPRLMVRNWGKRSFVSAMLRLAMRSLVPRFRQGVLGTDGTVAIGPASSSADG